MRQKQLLDISRDQSRAKYGFIYVIYHIYALQPGLKVISPYLRGV